MTRLSVNLNKIALLRNARGGDYPRVLDFAARCVRAGVHGLTVHPRPDERHIRRSDVYDLAAFLNDYPTLEFNIEGNPTAAFLDLVCDVRPTQCTLVPDAPDQITSDHGFDAARDAGRLVPIVARLKAAGIRTSLFMDPDPAQIEHAARTGAERIELYTEAYARAFGGPEQDATLQRYRAAAEQARACGLAINAGHDLNLANLARFLTIAGIEEVSIGHAIVVEAFDYGYDETLRRYLEIVAAA